MRWANYTTPNPDSVGKMIHHQILLPEDKVLCQTINIIANKEDKVHVLFMGERGSGKDELAKYLAYTSHRHTTMNRPIRSINAVTLPDTLAESELFGCIRGAATGVQAREGIIKMVDGGILILEEIGRLSHHVQGLLLKYMQDGCYRKLGQDRWDLRADVQLIATTNINVFDEKLFAQDLLDRFAYKFNVPSLRARRRDVLAIVSHVFKKHRSVVSHINPRALCLLVIYSWPGNIRELTSFCEKVVDWHNEYGSLDDISREVSEDFVRMLDKYEDIDNALSLTRLNQDNWDVINRLNKLCHVPLPSCDLLQYVADLYILSCSSAIESAINGGDVDIVPFYKNSIKLLANIKEDGIHDLQLSFECIENDPSVFMVEDRLFTLSEFLIMVADSIMSYSSDQPKGGDANGAHIMDSDTEDRPQFLSISNLLAIEHSIPLCSDAHCRLIKAVAEQDRDNKPNCETDKAKPGRPDGAVKYKKEQLEHIIKIAVDDELSWKQMKKEFYRLYKIELCPDLDSFRRRVTEPGRIDQKYRDMFSLLIERWRDEDRGSSPNYRPDSYCPDDN